MDKALLAVAIAMLIHMSVRAAETASGIPIPSFNIRTRPATEPVELSPGPHLFIDDYLVASSENLTRTTHPPVRYEGNPLLGWEQGTTQPYVSVVRDPETKLFRMWYNRDIGPGCTVAYAESEDGIHWRTPKLGVLGDDNRLFPVAYGAAVLDEGPAFPDKSRRFKLAWWDRSKPGMNVAFSSDGLHWTASEKNPVLPDLGEDAFIVDPRRPYGVSDIIDVYWDPIREHYGAFLKSPAIPADGLSTGPRAGNFIRRLVTASNSSDFVHWKQPWRVIVPEPRDPGILEFYAVGGTISRGGLLIGFVRMLHDDYPCEPGGPADGIGYATLATSRDGVHWERHDDTFFDRSPTPGAWDRAMTWIGCALPVGDELYLYYGGYNRGHKVEPTKERQLGLARMPLDRFVSRDATGNATGRLITTSFKHEDLAGRRIVLNADANQGRIRVRLLDEQGHPVQGANFDDAQSVTGDGMALPVGGLELSRAGLKPFKIEFKLERAQLFGFDVMAK